MLTLKTDSQVKNTVKNILSACKDIKKLKKNGYDYLYLASGFIAHYNLQGFIDYYSSESLKNDILAYARYNQWANFTPLDKDYLYYMQKKTIYNLILAGLK